MRARLLVCLACLATSRASAQDAIPVKILTEIKAATVFVKANADRVESSGSGFVFRVEGDTAYVATNHHVVVPKAPENVRSQAPPARAVVTLVFDSGTRKERSVRGELVAADDDRDLAVIKVSGVKDLPRPLDYAAPQEIVETTPVYTFGFPFGKLLSTSKGSPAITVGRGTVSSIRTDDDGRVAVVQIDGALNPGNSGGPVVASNGALIGIAVATIRGAQQIGLVIPQDQLVKMLDGRVGSVSLHTTKLQGVEAEIDVEVDLIDPLNRIADVAFLYVFGDYAANHARPSAGQPHPALPEAVRVPLTVAKSKAKGKVSLTFPNTSSRRISMQVAYRNGSGKEVYVQPAAQTVYPPSTASREPGPRPDHLTPTGRPPMVARRPPNSPAARAPIMPPRPSFPIDQPPAAFNRPETFVRSTPPSFSIGPRATPGREGKIEPFVSVTVAPKLKVAFTSTASAFLKQYAYPGFELTGSYKLPGPATQLAFDGGGQRLLALVTTSERLKFAHPTRQPTGSGDLHIYEMKDLISGADASTTDLTPKVVVPLGASVLRWFLSPDEKRLYLLERLAEAENGPARLVRIDLVKNEPDLELDFEEGAEAACISPGAKSIFVAVSPRGHAAAGFDRPEEGKIYMVNADTFEVVKTARIEIDPCDIQVDDDAQVLVSGGSNQHTGVAVVDMKKTRAIVATWKGIYMGASMQLSSNHRRLYIAERGISPGSIKSWLLPQDMRDTPSGSSIGESPGAVIGGEIFLTPDDKFLLTRFGGVIPVDGGRGRDGGSSPDSPRPRTPQPRRLGNR